MGPADPRAETVLDAHLAYLRALTMAGRGAIVDRDGCLLIRNPVSLPFLVNAVARTDPAVDASIVVAAATSFFGDQGFEVVCLEGRDDDLRAAAERARFRVGSPDPLQFLDGELTSAPAHRPAAVIRPIQDAADVAELVAINRAAHAAYGFPDELFTTLFERPASVLSPQIYAVLATVRGSPVATAQLFMDGETAYVGWVSVVPDARRQGLGWLVTETVVNEGLARGARAAVLVASPMGAPLYRRMGFVDVGALRNAYARPGSG